MLCIPSINDLGFGIWSTLYVYRTQTLADPLADPLMTSIKLNKFSWAT